MLRITRTRQFRVSNRMAVMAALLLVITAATGLSNPFEAPDAAAPTERIVAHEATSPAPVATESEQAFEDRASSRELLLAQAPADPLLPDDAGMTVPAGPREAIEMYWQILETYPNYERNDQVLYQLSRAYDEIGNPDKAMEVMDRFVREYPYSRYVDEVYFRRGEYWFVRKRFLDAEESYEAIIRMGASSDYYELALYKQGWALYKQELYEEALHRYMAMLDYRQSIGYDFDAEYDEDDDHRLDDTFRVISLSFSNLGGPEVLDAYFASNGHRSYADKIYGNLAEFYFEKLRFEDAAAVYKSFVDLNPYHKVSPHFAMRVVEIYGEAGFPKLVVESKKEFATRYAVDAEYWHRFDIADSPEVVGFLKTNLSDLANHYHALYQEPVFEDEQPQNFAEASRWYRQFLYSFPSDEETPQINYQLADLLLENEDFGRAALEYERTAYDYEPHEQAAAAGYAAIAPDIYRGGSPGCIVKTFQSMVTNRGFAFEVIEAARETLESRQDVDADRIGVAGFCMGGGFALIAAADQRFAVAADKDHVLATGQGLDGDVVLLELVVVPGGLQLHFTHRLGNQGTEVIHNCNRFILFGYFIFLAKVTIILFIIYFIISSVGFNDIFLGGNTDTNTFLNFVL